MGAGCKERVTAATSDDGIVVCDVSYSRREEAGYIREGQADFVVLVPEKGLKRSLRLRALEVFQCRIMATGF